jgi:hypothetical protein
MKHLKKIKRLTWMLLAIASITVACKKDPGNYVYTDINQALVAGLDTLYTVNQGEDLHISPKVTYSKDQTGDTTNYKYSWLEVNREGRNPGIPKLIDSTSTFDVKMKGNLGVYNYVFRVTDKKTGVWKDYNFKIFITNKTFEGWYLLSEVNGKESRLDMLSYKANGKKYEFISDVLAASNSKLELTGSPSFISFINYNGLPLNATQKDELIVGTSELATRLGLDTLEYLPNYDFSNVVLSRKNVAIGPGSTLEGRNFNKFLWANGKVFTDYAFGYFDINKMSPSDANPFKAAPFISSDLIRGSGDAILFNETLSEFVWYPGENGKNCLKIENETLFKNKIDKNLLFMKFSTYNGGETFAVLKDKTGDRVYLARFTVSKQGYFAEITDTPIAKAEHFEVSNDFGYVFYTIGGKLYEYDLNLKVNKEMADYGSRKISLLKFQYVDVQNNQRYLAITKRLCVCSYDEANLNNSGTMDLYSIPPINGKLVKEESFSGMGKIVSITYRSR